jgi:hypothetical protein
MPRVIMVGQVWVLVLLIFAAWAAWFAGLVSGPPSPRVVGGQVG